jgi:hypothetical protein
MEIPELIIAVLSAKSDGIDGRTVIQKLCYFTSVKIKMDAGYSADFYGPFSPLIAAHLKSLVGFDFVIEKGRRTVRDRIMYSYYLTDDGQVLAEKIKKVYPKEYSIVKDVVKKCDRIVHYNFYVLSWAAKVHFILRKTGRAMTYKEAIHAGRLFGWKLGEKEIESAIKLLLALGLIERT